MIDDSWYEVIPFGNDDELIFNALEVISYYHFFSTIAVIITINNNSTCAWVKHHLSQY